MPPVTTSTKAEPSAKQLLANNWLLFLGTLLVLIGCLVILVNTNQGDTLIVINKWRTPFWDIFFKVGTHFAEPVAYLGVLLIVTAFSFRNGIFALVAGIAAGLSAGLFKAIFAQARPMRWFFDNYEGIWHSLNHFEEAWRSWDTDSSFPSGHTTSAFALYGFLALTARSWKLGVSMLCLGLAAMVGFSRLYLLYHFLRDVAAGVILGILVGTVVYYLQFKVYPDKVSLDQGWLAYFRRAKPAQQAQDGPAA